MIEGDRLKYKRIEWNGTECTRIEHYILAYIHCRKASISLCETFMSVTCDIHTCTPVCIYYGLL